MLSSVQDFFVRTVAITQNPMGVFPDTIGTLTNDWTPPNRTSSCSRRASGGNWSTVGRWITSKFSIVLINHGKALVGRFWSRFFIGPRPAAHHSWVLSILSRLFEKRSNKLRST